MEMKKKCAKETSAIGVKISAKEIPSELKAKVLNDRFQVLFFQAWFDLIYIFYVFLMKSG